MPAKSVGPATWTKSLSQGLIFRSCGVFDGNPWHSLQGCEARPAYGDGGTKRSQPLLRAVAVTRIIGMPG